MSRINKFYGYQIQQHTYQFLLKLSILNKKNLFDYSNTDISNKLTKKIMYTSFGVRSAKVYK